MSLYKYIKHEGNTLYISFNIYRYEVSEVINSLETIKHNNPGNFTIPTDILSIIKCDNTYKMYPFACEVTTTDDIENKFVFTCTKRFTRIYVGDGDNPCSFFDFKYINHIILGLKFCKRIQQYENAIK